MEVLDIQLTDIVKDLQCVAFGLDTLGGLRDRDQREAQANLIVSYVSDIIADLQQFANDVGKVEEWAPIDK